MKGYCMKCRQKREMKQIQEMKKKGRKYVKGICEKCGTKMSVFTK